MGRQFIKRNVKEGINFCRKLTFQIINKSKNIPTFFVKTNFVKQSKWCIQNRQNGKRHICPI